MRTPYEEAIIAMVSRIRGLPSAVALPSLGIFLFAAQCLGVTRWRPNHARILFINSDLADALRALALLFLPFVMAAVAIVAMTIAGYIVRCGPRRVEALLWVIAAAVAAVFFVVFGVGTQISAWDVLKVSSVLALFFLLGATFGQVGKLTAAVLVVVLPICFLFVPGDPWLFGPQVWLPLERFYLNGGEQPYGYLVGASQDHLLVLLEDRRTIYLIDKGAVDARVYCIAVDVCHDPVRTEEGSIDG